MVFTTEDVVYLHHLKNILEAKGIECLIKNDRLASISGEIPMVMTWPELWVINPMYETWAKELIAESKQEASTDSEWTCENCGEVHSARFTDCWNCQATKAF